MIGAAFSTAADADEFSTEYLTKPQANEDYKDPSKPMNGAVLNYGLTMPNGDTIINLNTARSRNLPKLGSNSHFQCVTPKESSLTQCFQLPLTGTSSNYSFVPGDGKRPVYESMHAAGRIDTGKGKFEVSAQPDTDQGTVSCPGESDFNLGALTSEQLTKMEENIASGKVQFKLLPDQFGEPAAYKLSNGQYLVILHNLTHWGENIDNDVQVWMGGPDSMRQLGGRFTEGKRYGIDTEAGFLSFVTPDAQGANEFKPNFNGEAVQQVFGPALNKLINDLSMNAATKYTFVNPCTSMAPGF